MVIQRKPRPRRVLSRRSFIRWAGYGTLGSALTALGYSRFVEPWWIDFTHTGIRLRDLPPAFDGLRIAHLTDLHLNPVTNDEVERWIDKANHLGADLITLTGDYVTGQDRQNVIDVARLLGGLRAPLGVVACLGNHDYGTAYPIAREDHLAFGHFVRDQFQEQGIEVLINQHTERHRDGQTLHIAGSGDLWTADFDMDFLADAGHRTHVILSHNPDTLYSLHYHNFGLMLSGHTHGGQVQCPFLGPPRLPIKHRHLAEGHFSYERSQVYVSRGLGYLSPIRFRARPEMGIIQLQRA